MATQTKVDTAYIVRSATNGTVESFHISQLESAKNKAANLMAYHNEQFCVVIKNETRESAKTETVPVTKEGKRVLPFIKVLHECSLTHTRREF